MKVTSRKHFPVPAEPINIFASRIDLPGIAKLLRGLALPIEIKGTDASWQSIKLTWKTGWFRKSPTLTISHSPDYYQGPGWGDQLRGMQSYFSRFPATARTPAVIDLVMTFKFALAFQAEPDLHLDSPDERTQVILALAAHLNGVIFTPTSLRDARGRILISASGKLDTDAVLPKLTANERPAIVPAATGEEPEFPPPAPERIARRALCFTAVTAKALLEPQNLSPAEAEHRCKRLLNWVGELGLEKELEPNETALLHRPVGTLDEQDFVNAAWNLEGLAVLAWALRRFDLPPYDELVDPDALLKSMGFLDLNRSMEILHTDAIRPRSELRTLQNQIFALHWRVRDYRLRPNPLDFAKFAREAWFGPLDISLARLEDGDLAIQDDTISHATDEAFATVSSTLSERHKAINWLVNGGDIYSETDTST